MITLKNKIVTAVAAVLLTTSLASAQAITVNSNDLSGVKAITFSVEVEQLAKLVLTNEQLSDAGLTLSTLGANGVFTAADLQLAGTIEVETNMPSWNVLLTANNGGRLRHVTNNDYLKTSVGYSGSGALPDAYLRLYSCFEAGPVASCAPTSLTGVGGILTTSASVTTPISLAQSYNKATTGFTAADTDTNKKAYFGIYAVIPVHMDELAGDGTYEESISVSLQSNY